MESLNKYIKAKKHLIYLIVCAMSKAQKENDLESYVGARKEYYDFIDEIKKERWMTIMALRVFENYYKSNCALHHIVLP